MIDLVSLGEMMLRLSPPKYERLRRAASLDVRACGAQFNLAADLAVLGKKTAFLTRLPANELGDLARSLGESYGVDMSFAKFADPSKLGLVFVEFSAAPRQRVHLYDRSGSAASATTAGDFDWPAVLAGARFAYVDGIFPGLGPGCREATLAFAGAARQAGCTLCFDVNYRESLWTPAAARAMYAQVLPFVDILVTNRAVAEGIFDYRGSDEELLQAYRRDFGCQTVCLTYRTMLGIGQGRWRSLALHDDSFYSSQPFDFEVVDQFGTGDAFFAGFLYAYAENQAVQYALDFGGALCALAHTIEGDVATVSPGEVEALLAGEPSLITKR
jgi:2-dehydro-3-deoxygluconokinase